MKHLAAELSILRSWVIDLPIRHQGCLIAAVRGCDGVSKNCNAKPLVRFLRWTFMNPADQREVGEPGSFMSDLLTGADVNNFVKDWDMYPIHFIDHLMHAYEVIGYKHPEPHIRENCLLIYKRMVKKLHLNPESEAEMDKRLCEDRIALGTVA